MPFKTNTLAALFPSRGSNIKFQWQDYMVYIFGSPLSGMGKRNDFILREARGARS